MEQILIGNAIKNFRIAAGHSQQKFARICKMSNVSLSDIENNKQYPHNKNLINICKELNIDVSWLVISSLTDEQIPIIFKSKFRHFHGKLIEVLQDSIDEDKIPKININNVS